MKKFVALLLAGVMTLGLATTAFAAKSPAATTGTVSAATDASGNKVEVTVSETFKEADQAAVNEIKKDAAEVLKEAVSNIDASDYKLATVKEVSVPEGTVFPVTITFNVDGVAAGSKVIVLHYVNGAWKQETATAGNGTVAITLESLSPIAIYVEPAAAGNGTSTGMGSGNAANGNGAKVSPKTGSAPMMTYVVVIAAAAVAGMCITKKKHA